ncbi:MAG TPA: DUF4062 domain-containing protein [Methanotrichaceae archaeon]|nr:DUF4062 domain-containing protein [Methanotrichaceae archaeon]
MSYKATVFKVMIASPGDVLEERKLIREVLHEWNDIHSEMRKIVLLPVAWETHSSPDMGDRPQAIINRQLKDCDLLVGVFWTRIGTATGEYPSGTVEEIEEHIKKEKPTMLYFSSASVRPDNVDPDQYSELKKFKDSCESRGLFEKYSDTVEFKDKFDRQLQRKLNSEPCFTELLQSYTESAGESTILLSPELSMMAQILLKKASLSDDGIIIHTYFGIKIGEESKDYQSMKPREIAESESAVEELERFGLIKDQGYEREVFKVTREGFEKADSVIL